MHNLKNGYPQKSIHTTLLSALSISALLTIIPSVCAAQAAVQPPQEVKIDSASASVNQIKSLISTGQLQAALDLMQTLETHHENDAEYFYDMGRVASQLEQHQLAANCYERAVLIRPNYVGAWLELAIASFALGNREIATSYLTYIQDNFHPSKEVLHAVEKELHKYTAASKQAKAKTWNFSLDLGTGVDTNANSGLRVDSLSLTNGDLREFFTLDDKFKARTDRFLQLGAGMQYTYYMPDQKLSFFSSAKQKSFSREHDYATTDLQASLAYQKNTKWGELSYWMQLQHIALGGAATLTNSKFQVQLERPWRSCSYALGAELERRFFLQSPNMDGRLLWGQGGLTCPMMLGRVPLMLNITHRIGQDFATRDRAGGNSMLNETVAQVTAVLNQKMKVSLSQAYATSHDDQGYSPKLENNIRRSLGRYVTRLQFEWKYSSSFDLLMNIENYHVNTNIALFKQGSQVLSIHARQAF